MIARGAKDGRKAVRGAVATSVDEEGEETDDGTAESKDDSGDVRDQQVSTLVIVDIDHFADCYRGWGGVVRIPGCYHVSLVRRVRNG